MTRRGRPNLTDGRIDIDLDDIDMSGAVHRPCPERGVLNFWYLPPPVENAELSQQWNDYEQRHWRSVVHRDRPATPVEKYLLGYIGYGPLPTNLQTRALQRGSAARMARSGRRSAGVT